MPNYKDLSSAELQRLASQGDRDAYYWLGKTLVTAEIMKMAQFGGKRQYKNFRQMINASARRRLIWLFCTKASSFRKLMTASLTDCEKTGHIIITCNN